MKKYPVFIGKTIGFTLIELMLTVAIIAIFAMIAMPSYQEYIRRSHLAQVQQEMQKLAEQLERHKAKNFSYKGFDASYLYQEKSGTQSSSFDTSAQTLELPLASTNPKFRLSIIGFYSVNELEEQKDGNKVPKGLVIKSDLLTKTINFDKSKMDDLFAIGSNWAIKAESLDARNYSVLLNSLGARCMNKKDLTKVTYTSCGTQSDGAVAW